MKPKPEREPDPELVLKFLESVKASNRTFTLYEVITILKYVPTLADQEPESKHLEGFRALLKAMPTAEAAVRIAKESCALTLQDSIKCFLALGASKDRIPIDTLDERIAQLKSEIAEKEGKDNDSFSA